MTPCNGEDQEEEHEHKYGVSEKRHGVYQCRDDNSETLHTGYGPKGSDDSERSEGAEVDTAALKEHAHVA